MLLTKHAMRVILNSRGKEITNNEEENTMRKELTVGDYENYTLTLTTSNNQKAWLAEITGKDEKYGFARKFIEVNEYIERCVCYKLEEGKLYNWNERREQHFGIVEDGKLYEISKSEALELIENK
jgi:hypothetical protein